MKIYLSLITVFFAKWWKRYSKCVSPLLMGAVLALCSGLDVYASSFVSGTYDEAFIFKLGGGRGPDYNYNILQTENALTWSMYPSSIDVIDITSGVNLGSFSINAVDDSLSLTYSSYTIDSSRSTTTTNSSGQEVTITSGTSDTTASGSLQAPEYTIDFDDVTFNSNVSLIAHYDKSFEYYLYYRNLISGSKPKQPVYDVQYGYTGCEVDLEYRLGIGMDWVTMSADYYNNIGLRNYWGILRIEPSEGIVTDMIPLGFSLSYVTAKDNVTSFSLSDFLLQLKLSWQPSTHSTAGSLYLIYSDVEESISNDIAANTDRTADQQKEYHDQDQADATQAGQDMSGFAAQLDNLKNTWSILWYPIEFTNSFVQVFTGGTQAAAYDDFNYISGYRYNNDTGMLEPMMSRSIQPRSSGTGITFPSIQLMGYTLWEPYTYDLSTLKDQFPVIFDALYVFISMLEVFWFVGFLRSKYNEVFG